MSNRIVKVSTSQGDYNVLIGKDLNIGELVQSVHEPCKVLLITDDTVQGLYGEKVSKSIEQAGFDVVTYAFLHGEKSKTMETIIRMVEFAGENHLSRTDLIVALGGGVVGDMAGFASAIYMRGIDFVQLPTTLLAAVDSSVGGKTGVDLCSGKNLAGAFHQPIAVFLDTDFFATLPKATFAEGMAEAIKYGCIMDEELFETFEKGSYDIEDICERCIAHKAEIVHADEFEKNIRKILNFGHTPAHAIEKLSNYSISHGEAVAIGMVIMARISEQRGLLAPGQAERIRALLEREGLPTSCDYTANELKQVVGSDKKRRGNYIDLVFLSKIGKAEIESVEWKIG